MKQFMLLLTVLLPLTAASADSGATPAAAPPALGSITGSAPISDLTGGLTPLPPSGVYTPQDAPAYVLGPGDTISINVTPQDRYSLGNAAVSQDGTVMYPRLGSIQVSGLTVAELTAQITQKLEQYCVNPSVTVVVTGLRPEPIYITGGVGSPKILDVRAAGTLAKAITLAGGANDQNMLSRVTVFRGTQTLHADVYKIIVDGVDNGQNMVLEPNDLIVVPINTTKIDVLGAVNAPGVQTLTAPGGNEGPMHMSDAISQAGGIVRQGARLHEVRLVRANAQGKPITTNYDYGKFMQYGDMSQNPVLQDKDMIVVPDSRATPGFGDLWNYWSAFSIFKTLR